MAKTYLAMTNELLVELNEPELTSISTAVGIQKQVANCVNRAYFDIVDAVDDWSWLSTSNPQDDYYGNTYIETVAGTRWYLLKSGSANVDSDYDSVNWNAFTATTEGVSGKSAPYTINKLAFTTLTVWRDTYAKAEELDKSDSQTYGTPLRVIRSSDGRRFGLSPIPDGVYRIYFYAYTQPTELSAHGDTVVFPKQYTSVLLAKARYYIHQFKDNMSQAQLADVEFQNGLRTMREQLLEPFPVIMDDRRSFYV